MSDCSFIYPTAALTSQGGIVPQISNFKPPNEVPSSPTFNLEEEKDAASLFLVQPTLHRLDSSSEEGDRSALGSTASPTTSGNTRENPPRATAIFGNGLGVHGVPAHSPPCAESVAQVFNPTFSPSTADVRESVRLGAPTGTPIVVNNIISSDDRDNSINDSVSPFESKNSGAFSSTGCLSPTTVVPNSSSSSNNNSNNNSNSNNSASGQAFPSEPSILADKYIILGPVDASTSHAIFIKNHQPLHVKAVSPRTALEVSAQQGLLGECDGVRAPFEAVMSGCGKRAWLLFPPHYGDLHSYVRLRRRLREAEAQRLFGQVAATVERCHASGLVLRDLKLRKFVFTDPNGQNVVLESVEDSVVARESDLLHDKHGCPAYVAPEILSAAAYSGRHADMWGLGVILYTMLVGRYPFHNADTNTLFARIRSGKFLIPDWVSSRARHLILSLLRRQPHRRLSARQVLLHPWLNRSPRDHVGKEPSDHIVPSTEHRTHDSVSSSLGKI